MITAVKAYYDGSNFVPLQNYTFKPQQQVLIIVDEEPTKHSRNYSESLKDFRSRYTDFLENEAETQGLDIVFDNVRDKTEPLRGTEPETW